MGYEASVSEQTFASALERPDDRVQVSFGLSEYSLSNQTSGSVAFGSSGDIKFNGGMGTGLGEAMRRGYGFGQAVQQTLSPTGSPGGPVGLLVSGQITNQGIDFHPGVGTMSSRGGRGRNRSSQGDSSDQQTPSGTILQFNASGGDLSAAGDNLDLVPDSSGAQSLSMNADNSEGSASNNGWTMPTTFAGMPGVSGFGADTLPGAFGTATLFNSFPAEPSSHFGGFGGQENSGPAGVEHPRAGGFEARGPLPATHAGFHGRFGSDVSTFTGKVRVNLGDLDANGNEKPIITAMAVDSETHEVWAAMGNTLVIFSKDGDPVGIFYPTIAGETRVKPVALLIEHDRLLIATDPWGIYEFARPDKLSVSSPGQSIASRQKNPQPN